MSDSVVLYEVRDRVALVTLNRPDRLNAWNQAVANGLSDALEAANGDDGVRAVVVTGAGRAFCAGADLDGGGDTFAGRTDDGSRPPETDPTTTRRNIYPYQIGKPVIAAINGAGVGGHHQTPAVGIAGSEHGVHAAPGGAPLRLGGQSTGRQGRHPLVHRKARAGVVRLRRHRAAGHSVRVRRDPQRQQCEVQ